MSADPSHAQEHDQEHVHDQHEHEQDHDHADLDAEDVVEVVEDDGDGDVGMEMDDDDDDNAQYDGEIVIGAPMPGEEEAYYAEMEDNSWGAVAVHAAQKSVFSIALHPLFPSPALAVTGGEDDLAYIFCPLPPSESSFGLNYDTYAPVALTGHTDSIVGADWSHDGEMVATAGMDGRVRVWRRVGDGWANFAFVTSLETGSEVQWVKWHPKGNVLSAGCEDSSVWLWQLPSGNTMTVLSSHTLPVTAGLYPPPLGRQLLTSSLDSTLILWNPTTSTPIFKTSVFCPPNTPDADPAEVGITALAVSPNGALAAAGGAAGRVKLVSLPKGDVVATLTGHAEGESVEALVFIDLLAGAGAGKGVVLVSAATDGKALVWDVATGRVRAELKHDEPITSLAPHPPPALHLVTTASADRVLKTWDVRTGALVAEHKGHGGVVNGVVAAPAPQDELNAAGAQAQVVVSAGDEGVTLVWKV
ncbi:60S ribosomal subunit assembly or modification protein [Cryptotrichosporon argae]